MLESEYWAWMHDIFSETWRVQKDNSYLYVSHTDRGIFSLKPILEDIGYHFLQMIVWYGPNGYSMQRSRKTWSYRHEPILIFEKGDAPFLLDHTGVWYTSVIEAARPQSNFRDKRTHPTQKPLSLYHKILDRTPGEIIYDPMIGSGTTAVAAKILGRRWLAFEIDPDVAERARERVRNTQPPLFVLEPQQAEMDL